MPRRTPHPTVTPPARRRELARLLAGGLLRLAGGRPRAHARTRGLALAARPGLDFPPAEATEGVGPESVNANQEEVR